MKFRALVFDDEISFQLLIECVLKQREYEVFKYASPFESSLDKIHKCECSENQCCADFIISDYAMPGKTGLDFIESLIRKGCKIKHFAIISGSWIERDIKRADAMGCTIIDKPFDVDDLINWVAEKEKTISPDRILKDLDE